VAPELSRSALLKVVLPAEIARRLSALRRRVVAWPPVGLVRFGSLRRLTPISRRFGYDRGSPIDRHYIEHFLMRHEGVPGYARGDIRGAVLEVGDRMYADRFVANFPGAVTSVDVLHVDESNPQATIVGDLVSGHGVPVEAFDTIICTQTLHLLYDVSAAVSTLHSALKPGGVVLATLPAITPSARPDRDLWGDHWRFTALSARKVFESAFPAEAVTVDAYGNVLVSVAFLHGLAAQDLRRSELEARDPDHELLIGVRARKLRPTEARPALE
jgi:SAM-dependent methyltransferase